MSHRDVPLYLMETLKRWSSLQHSVVCLYLITVSKGSACEAPSSPECFRRTSDESVYTCQWSMNTTVSDVTFDLYFNTTKCRNIKQTWCQLNEEQLIKYRPVHIWVEARAGNSSCMSTRRSVVLGHTVKYEAPQNICMSWVKNNLNLSWIAAEEHPALAELRLKRHEHPTESWEKRTTNTSYTSMYHVIVVNLLKDSAYQVQIRHRSTQARNPLWSDWSPVVIVPADLEQKPEVTVTTTLLNGNRKVTLTWKPMPHAASVTGVEYSLKDTSNGCPCEKNRAIKTTKHISYVSLSAANISIIARNAAGFSPPAIIEVPTEPDPDLKVCDKTLLDEKLNRSTCLEWYELQDEDSKPENVITLTARKNKKQREQVRKNLKDYVRYVYFEHRCDRGKPKTVERCIFYHKEGVPCREPQDFIASSETHTSANFSWKAIPSVDQRGFLTHYSLCSVKISSQVEPKECFNISASLLKHRLENLTPGAKYTISLVGVTRAGEGPAATVTINTLPEKAGNVWWSLVLLFPFISMTTCILKRIKNKIFPPVPTPVIIPDFILYQPESQDLLERKEEVHELTLHQLHPEAMSVAEDAETAFLARQWDDGTDEDVESERGDSRMSEGSSGQCELSPGSADEELRSSREGEMTDLEQVDTEIAMLIYRNGLVFDVKTDSP